MTTTLTHALRAVANMNRPAVTECGRPLPPEAYCTSVAHRAYDQAILCGFAAEDACKHYEHAFYEALRIINPRSGLLPENRT